ncbi:urease accessory protein UreD [Iningainema tapete]|uniref:Urease accessory protein UreD n=1 Tax=Iningainema tapete BLCC-T55 TaxID=2748662 RepID=A0A8J6XLI4_9CYAN|nr:urease accessory protein UreD [Iningainema tapete]MBD2773854.1 urease accessory protein UreD [Iningainema tapete BLCC-T55]
MLLEFTKRANLELKLECDRNNYTIDTHRYTAYPLRLSRLFRLEPNAPQRAYFYITSISPGLLAQDELNLSIQLAANTSLYLTDQAATKVHSMPIIDSKAVVHYNIEVGEQATLEFIPEPMILFADSTLQQNICIKLHPSARLCLSEIIIPGRLARGEFYDFHHYFSRLVVMSQDGELWFTDAMRLEGKLNPFKDKALFATAPILGNLFVVLPNTDLDLLSKRVEDLDSAHCSGLLVASSILPQEKGILIRAIATTTRQLKQYLKYALNCVRQISNQPPLPYIPK